MIPVPSSTDIFSLRVRTQSKSNAWSIFVLETGVASDKIEDFKEEIEIISSRSVSIFMANEGVEALLKELDDSISDYYLIWNFDSWDVDQWQMFDMLRSHLDRGTFGGVLILSKQAVELMFDYAPNFTSWAGGRVYALQESSSYLTEEEIEGRLTGFRIEYNYSDEQLIDLASKKDLSLNPDLGEWLVLLGREDLIEHNG
jgi:hypothetical protein